MEWLNPNDQAGTTGRAAIAVARRAAALIALTAMSHLAAQTPVTLPAEHVTAARVDYAPGQDAKIKGLILSRDGDDMTVHDENGTIAIVTLTADTKISSPSGLFKLDKKQRDVTSLLPGLIIEVKGSGGARGNLVANSISFHSSALRVAQQMAAGDVVLNRRVTANTNAIDALKAHVDDSLAVMSARVRDSLAAIDARFDDIDRYDARANATVTFRTGSDELSSDDRAALDALVANGTQLNGYLIEVTGYADAVGNSAANQSLSARRAQAVVAYLTEVRDVPLRRILNPTGLGESHAVASNQTAEGRAMNRRAVVVVLVNRATRP